MTEVLSRDDWRAQVQEDALDPDLPIIDPHHHIWPEPPVPGMEPWGPEALIDEKVNSPHNIVATVFVQAHARYKAEGPEQLRPIGETEFVESVARQAEALGGKARGTCAGMVVGGDLMLGEAIDEVLEVHLAASDRVRGIRDWTAYDENYPIQIPTQPGMMADPRFRAAVSRLAKYNLSLDLWAFHPQMGDVADLAAAFPDTTFIIDHVGVPMGTGKYADRGGNGFEEWRAGLTRAAQQPNIMMKLGGLNMEPVDLYCKLHEAKPWSSQKIADVQGDHVRIAIDLFGPKRCMFESNFPVDRMATSYTVLWNSFKRMAERYSADEKADLFFNTAKRVYRLDV